MIGIKEADKNNNIRSEVSRRLLHAVVAVVVVVVVLVVGVGHPAGNKTKRPTNENLKRQQCFSNKLINKRLILKKTVQIRNGAHSLMTKYQLPAEHK